MMCIKAATLLFLCLVSILMADGAASTGEAWALSSRPGWSISSVAEPTDFSVTDNAKCSAGTLYRYCDSYTVTVTNVGGAETHGQIRISDILPAGLKLVGMRGQSLDAAENPVGCSVAEAACVYAGTVAPGGTLTIVIRVEDVSAVSPVTNTVTVEGGGATVATTSPSLTMPNTVGEGTAPYGIAAFGMQAFGVGGALDRQAYDWPQQPRDAGDL